MTYDDAAARLASCLAFLAAESPDLGRVVTAWPSLPEAIKAAILAIIGTATEAKGISARTDKE